MASEEMRRESESNDMGTGLGWPPEFDEVATDLRWDDRRKRYAWRRKLGETNPNIAAAEGYSRWNAQRLRGIVYDDLSRHTGRDIHNAVEFANELERQMRTKRARKRT